MKRGRGGWQLQKNPGEPDGLEGPETKQAASPHAGQSPTRSGGGRQAPGCAQAVTGPVAPESPSGGIRSDPDHRCHCGSPVHGRDETPPPTLLPTPAAASRSAWPQCRGQGHKRGLRAGRVNAPYRDSGERTPLAGCPGTRESQGDRDRVQSRTQSWEKKAATDAKMAGSATSYARLKARLLLSDRVSDWVTFILLHLIG